MTMARPLGIALAVTVTMFVPGSAQQPASINLAAFANGALVESSTSDYGSGWEARWLTDESADTGWSSEQGKKGPFEIVLSLPDRSEIRSLEFDTARAESEARAAKDVDVTISDTSASAGFAQVASVSLKAGADKQVFPVSVPARGRWIKVTIKTNHGDQDYSQLMEFRALGVAISRTPMPTNLSGTYSSDNYGDFHLQQTGAALIGCYEHNEGLVQGGAESQLMRLTWHETGSRSGPAIMVLKRDGKSFEGWWTNDGGTHWNPNWDLKKKTDTIGSCPHWDLTARSGNVVATELGNEGRVRLYGINFDVDSDRLRGDAAPAIEQLVSALKLNPGWNVSIEGHTDSTGTAARNLQLSQLRAAAVKTALVGAGIAADRLTTTGLGQTKPVASNDTEVGRAQNRRVEVVRK